MSERRIIAKPVRLSSFSARLIDRSRLTCVESDDSSCQSSSPFDSRQHRQQTDQLARPEESSRQSVKWPPAEVDNGTGRLGLNGWTWGGYGATGRG